LKGGGGKRGISFCNPRTVKNKKEVLLHCISYLHWNRGKREKKKRVHVLNGLRRVREEGAFSLVQKDRGRKGGERQHSATSSIPERKKTGA